MLMKNSSDTIGNRTCDLFPPTEGYYTVVFSLNDLFTPSQRVTPILKEEGLIFQKNLLPRNGQKNIEEATLGRIQISTTIFESHFNCSDFCCLLHTSDLFWCISYLLCVISNFRREVAEDCALLAVIQRVLLTSQASFTRRFVNAIPVADSCNIADSENVTYVRSSQVSFLRQSSLCFRLVQFV